MEKNELKGLQVSESTINELNNGFSNRVYGGSRVEEGFTGVIQGFDIIETEIDGVKRKYAAVVTDNGNVAVSALMGRKTFFDMLSKDELSKVYQPKSRKLETWLTSELTEMAGEKITCVKVIKEAQTEPFVSDAKFFTIG